jgi:hypothetical protein
MLNNYQEKFRERLLLVLLYKTNQKHTSYATRGSGRRSFGAQATEFAPLSG